MGGPINKLSLSKHPMTKIAIVSDPATRDAARTREAILRAAQNLFAQKGYTTVGVREIAAAAGVTAALITRYFESKEGLLRAAILDILIVDPFIDGPRESFGARAVSVLHAGDVGPSAMGMMILATADADARDMCSDLMLSHITAPLADWIGGDNAMSRATQINMMWIGYMTARHVLPLAVLTEQADDAIEHWLARTLQAIVDQSA